MVSVRARYLLILVLTTFVSADRISNEDYESTLLKNAREATNKTEADTLNLPANASSIRENITDTFSCENRTYGYYADVDNDCQVFHVCLPSQTPSGRNVTYRWSFICPNETIFNQEVLTCTRVPDSIDCKDSPNFYHVNMEFGKVTKKKEETKEKRKSQKRQPLQKKESIVMENMVMENVIKEIIDEDLENDLQGLELGLDKKREDEGPILIDAVIEIPESETEDIEAEQSNEEKMDRLAMERNIRNEKEMRRGALRFDNDSVPI